MQEVFKIADKKRLILAFGLTVLSVSFIRASFEAVGANKRFEEAQREVEDLEQKKAKLADDIQYKKSVEFVEERARNALSMVKTGEKVYVVGERPIAESGGEYDTRVLGSKDEVETRRGNIYLWYKLFFP